MVIGYLGEDLVRQRLRPSGWDKVESPLAAVGLALASAMALAGLGKRRAISPEPLARQMRHRLHAASALHESSTLRGAPARCSCQRKRQSLSVRNEATLEEGYAQTSARVDSRPEKK